ncbi:MAG: PAS domain S-box protein [Chitinophagaceae bacterium]|nr:PAS domain S-box protein [Chitinophagaceae bacterium]
MHKPTHISKGYLLPLLYPILVVTCCAAVITGWSFDIGPLKRILPGAVSMNPLTAILFVACSVVIILNFRLRRPTRLAAILSFFIATIGLLKIISYLSGYETGIDQLLFADKLENEKLTGHSNQMAPNTAFNFMLLGIALLTYRINRKWNKLSDILTLLVAFSAFLSLIGYMYNAHELYGIANYIPMAVPTAMCFLLTSISLLLNRKGSYILKTLTNQYSGSRMARYLLPLAVIIPVLLGLLRIYGQQAGFFTGNFGTAIFAAANIMVFLFLILQAAASINKKDKALHEFNLDLEKKVEERTAELNRSSKKFQSLIENSVDAISMLDEDGRILFSSVAMQKLSGYPAERLAGARALSIIHPDDHPAVAELNQLVLASKSIAYSSTFRVMHADGSYRWVEGTIVNWLEDQNVRAIVTNFHDITEKKKLMAEKLNRQKQITEATISGQEKERKEIGMELHDNVNQILAAGKLYLDMALKSTDNREEIITLSRESIMLAIEEIRRLSRALVPPAAGATGIATSIREFAELISFSSGLEIDLQLPVEIMDTLDENERLALYRIIQEQLNNIVKHAHAKKTIITLGKRSGLAVLQIKDDGKGFNPGASRSGIGLSNIRNRVEMFNGKFELHSAPGEGCEMLIELPVDN